MSFQQDVGGVNLQESRDPVREVGMVAETFGAIDQITDGFASALKQKKVKDADTAGDKAAEIELSMRREEAVMEIAKDGGLSPEEAAMINAGDKTALDIIGAAQSNGMNNPTMLRLKKNIKASQFLRENPGAHKHLTGMMGMSMGTSNNLLTDAAKAEKLRQEQFDMVKDVADRVGVDIVGLSHEEAISKVHQSPLYQQDQTTKNLLASAKLDDADRDSRNKTANIAAASDGATMAVSFFDEFINQYAGRDPATVDAHQVRAQMVSYKTQALAQLQKKYADHPEQLSRLTKSFNETFNDLVPLNDLSLLTKQETLDAAIYRREVIRPIELAQAEISLDTSKFKNVVTRGDAITTSHRVAEIGTRMFGDKNKRLTEIAKAKSNPANAGQRASLEAEESMIKDGIPNHLRYLSRVEGNPASETYTHLLGEAEAHGISVSDATFRLTDTIAKGNSTPEQELAWVEGMTMAHQYGSEKQRSAMADGVIRGIGNPEVLALVSRNPKIRAYLPEVEAEAKKAIASAMRPVLEDLANTKQWSQAILEQGSFKVNSLNYVTMDTDHLDATGTVRFKLREGIENTTLREQDVRVLQEHLLEMNLSAAPKMTNHIQAIKEIGHKGSYSEAVEDLMRTDKSYMGLIADPIPEKPYSDEGLVEVNPNPISREEIIEAEEAAASNQRVLDKRAAQAIKEAEAARKIATNIPATAPVDSSARNSSIEMMRNSTSTFDGE